MTTIKMLAPAAQAGLTFKIDADGNSYTSDANGLINANLNDVNALESGGFLPLTVDPVVTLGLSSAAGILTVPGAVNLVPVSTFAAIAVIPQPVTIGLRTKLVSLSTGNVTLTVSSLATILTEKGAAVTTLTCGLGTAELIAVGSTLLQLVNRSINTSSAGAVYGILSS